jgi:hypothetical protein
MRLGEEYSKLWCDRVYFALAAGNSDSNSAAHLSATRLHVTVGVLQGSCATARDAVVRNIE